MHLLAAAFDIGGHGHDAFDALLDVEYPGIGQCLGLLRGAIGQQRGIPLHHLLFDLLADVGGKLDDAEYLAVFIQHRIVVGLQPYGAAITGQPLDAAAVMLTAAQALPQCFVLLTGGEFRRA